MADPATYTKGDWTNLTPAATKAKMENIEDGIKAANDALIAETDAGRAITQAADAAAQRSALGLDNVDNTSDANKPVSTAQSEALALKVDKVTGKGLSTEDYTTAEKSKLSGVEASADVTDEANVTAAAAGTAEVTAAPDHIWVLVGGALKRWTKAGFEAVVKALLPSAIEGGTATTTPNDTDIIPGVKADHTRLYYTWANLKAAILTAIGKVNAAVGFTLAGGTTPKTLTVSADADSKDIPTAAGKSAADAIGAASGADTGAKIKTLVGDASTSNKGVALLAADGGTTAGTAVQGNDSRLSNARTPTAHKASHESGGADAIASLPTPTEKTALGVGVATSGGSPWSVPTLYFIDQARAELERISGGRATIFYSADGNKIPIQAVWIDAFTCADVSPYYSRSRANSTAYLLGEWIMANSQLYEVTTAGTTAASPPTYGVNPGDAVTDGTAVLTLRVNAYDDLFPAFKVAGVSKGGKWISRFLCSVSGANPMSIAGQLPSSQTIDAIRTLATKFTGASPMGYWDYEALALDAFRKGITPVGNTNYGRSHKSPELVWGGVRGDSARPGNTAISTNPYTRGGSAGLIWTHDRTIWGVHDFVGNMSQWCDGAKWMDGQLYIAAYDADPANFSTAGEASWIATGISLNSPVAGDDSGSSDLGAPNFESAVTNYTASVTPPRDIATIKADTRDLDYASGTWGSNVVSVGIDTIDAVKRLSAFRMGIMPKSRYNGPAPVSAQEGRQYIRNNGERFVLRGGYYFHSSFAGPRYSLALYRRSYSSAFRLVFNG